MTKRLTQDEIISRFTEIHGNTYDYSKVEYVNMHTKVEIVCRDHGSFFQVPLAHIYQKQRCRKCTDIEQAAHRATNINDLIARFVEVHGDKYDYSKVEYVQAHKHIEIICKKHGSFFQTSASHYSGNGCRKCCISTSKISQEWLDSLGIDTIIREYQISESRFLLVDGYDATTNTVYQFHGDYWHGNIATYDADHLHKQSGKTMRELYERTLLSDQRLRDWGYNLVVMWERDWKIQRKQLSAS